jgi:hypothetical protein
VSEKTANDFLAAVTVLDANIKLFQEGVRDVYRVVATELRKLLCDGKGTLLPRVFVDLRFHKLHSTHLFERNPSLAEGLTAIPLPGRLEVTNGKPHFRLLFADTMEQMGLEDWLDQPFLAPDLSIRELIRSVADKEGAHADPRYNDTLARAKCVRYVTDESHLHCIIGIAEYVLAFIRREPLEVVAGVPLRRREDGDWERT